MERHELIGKMLSFKIERDNLETKNKKLESEIKKLTKQLSLTDVINWVAFKEQEPEDEVKEYLTCNDNGDIQIIEWFEGDYFRSSSGGHWSDENGFEIGNITHWAELPEPPCL